jgi:N-acetyl sugar amidotransferase
MMIENTELALKKQNKIGKHAVQPIIQCSRCIMDSNDDPDIKFDAHGVCQYCLEFDKEKKVLVKEGKDAEELMAKTIAEIKEYGKNKKYDCLIGLSGGVDSSYVAYIAKQKGLRALCVHFDNGWNSELAVMNIQNIVTKLGFDLYTYVIDWEEFKDLQLAYLKASVIDIEVITDHAIYGTIYKIAKENDLKYILGGHNVVTEGILPHHWAFNIKDYINIKDIHSKYGTKKLNTFPFLNRKMKRYITNSGVRFVNFLNWLPYVKTAAKKTLQQELDWRDYGSKHHESIWTKFYQVYILPIKFGVDKRKAHLSTLICSGQITKEEALKEISKPAYDDLQIRTDKEFVLKKLGLTENEFDKIMKEPVRSHWSFNFEGSIFHYYPILKPFRPLWESIKSLRGLWNASWIVSFTMSF